MMKVNSYVAPWTEGLGTKPKPDPLKEFFKKIKWKPASD